jgi:hypothetical protein
MKESDLTPEIIAEKIFGWKYKEYQGWSNGSSIVWTSRSLPHFGKPEWTGLLLDKAAAIGVYSLVNWNGLFTFLIGDSKVVKNKEINYAIILAICEAKGL